jgi:acetoacetate decarboxylase
LDFTECVRMIRTHFVADVTLGLGEVVHAYLA